MKAKERSMKFQRVNAAILFFSEQQAVTTLQHGYCLDILRLIRAIPTKTKMS